MKLALFFILLFTCAGITSAQPGIFIGGDRSYQHRQVGNLEMSELSNESVPGLTMGFFYRTKPVWRIVAEPSLSYIRKGSQYEPVGLFVFPPDYEIQKMEYLQLSLPFLYRIPIAKSADITVGAGPYAAYLVKVLKLTHYSDGTEVRKEEKTIAYGDWITYRPLDLGVRFAAGVKYKHWLCNLSYDLGLNDLAPDSRDDVVRNRSVAVTFGRML